MSRRILIVDDEEAILKSLEGILTDEGYEVALASSAEEGLECVGKEDPDLVLLDIWLPGMDGLCALKALRSQAPLLPVLMMSGHGTVETTSKAARLGAYDFIEKPLNLDKVLLVIGNALRASRLREENRFWRGELQRQYPLVGQSPAFLELRERILGVASTGKPVFIAGERGTGKALVARAVHEASERSEAAFLEADCASLPEDLVERDLFGQDQGAVAGTEVRRRGKLDLADGGTLFLNGVGHLGSRTQAKLVRLLQETRFERAGGSCAHRADVLLLASSDEDLESAVREGRFREDLYARLKGNPLRVPPLRERAQDIPLLAEHFIRTYCTREKRDPVALAPGVCELLSARDWPGNIRELKNVAERMVLLSTGPEVQPEIAALALGVGFRTKQEP